jgi:hypothetical protein
MQERFIVREKRNQKGLIEIFDTQRQEVVKAVKTTTKAAAIMANLENGMKEFYRNNPALAKADGYEAVDEEV